MRQIRRLRPSPAMVVAALALTIALGGTATAAGLLITGKQVKDGSLAGRDVKNGTIKGADVLESSLAQVPSAASATSATSAQSATTAQSANTANSATAADMVDGKSANELVRAASGTQSDFVNTPPPPSLSPATAVEVTIAAPGPGYVVVTSAVNITLNATGTAHARVWLEDLSTGQDSPTMQRLTSSGADFSPTYVFPVNSAGARTYALRFRSGSTTLGWTAEHGMITAIYVPFNGSGVTP